MGVGATLVRRGRVRLGPEVQEEARCGHPTCSQEEEKEDWQKSRGKEARDFMGARHFQRCFELMRETNHLENFAVGFYKLFPTGSWIRLRPVRERDRRSQL